MQVNQNCENSYSVGNVPTTFLLQSLCLNMDHCLRSCQKLDNWSICMALDGLSWHILVKMYAPFQARKPAFPHNLSLIKPMLHIWPKKSFYEVKWNGSIIWRMCATTSTYKQLFGKEETNHLLLLFQFDVTFRQRSDSDIWVLNAAFCWAGCTDNSASFSRTFYFSLFHHSIARVIVSDRV